MKVLVQLLIGVLLLVWGTPMAMAQPTFVRGDANSDGGIDIADPVTTFSYLFLAGSPPSPVVDAADSNDNGVVELADSSYTLRYWSVILPMIRYNALFDYTADFSNYARICLEGYQDCMAFENPVTGADDWTERYTDPLTSYTYIASRSDRPALAIGAKLLVEAQEFATLTWLPATQTLTTCESTTPGMCDAEELAVLEAERGVNRRTSFIDIIRDIGYAMD